MRKVYCDLCKNECTKSHEKIEFPCHLWEFYGRCGYIDGNGNPVSGRMNTVDACVPCYNKCYGVMADTARKIMEEK